MNVRDPNLHREAPNNIEAEQTLLGAILVANAAFDRVSSFLDPEHFYEPLHRKIYQVCADFIRAGKVATPIILKSYLPATVDGLHMPVAEYLMSLASDATTISNARNYGEAVHDMWIRRQAIMIVEEIAELAYDAPADTDPLVGIAPLEEKLIALRAQRIQGQENRGASAAYLDRLNLSFQRGEVHGVPIAMAEVGHVISEPCFEAGNLYGLLSSSGEGKTSLTIQIMLHALRKGHPVLFLSYDQSADQVLRQMVAQTHGIEARRQRDAKLLSEKEFETCVSFANWLGTQPFEIVKCSDQKAVQLVGFARTFVKRNGNGKVPLVVVDHIQAVEEEDKRADPGTKAKQKNRIFKSAAERTESAWLVLNQRNSQGLSRENPRPVGADLYGGEAARYDYDAIFYLYRFIKFLKERQAVASKPADHTSIERVFPAAVRLDGEDIAEVGAIKVRFGDAGLRSRLIFEGRFTRYKPDQPAIDQAELIEGGF